MPTRCSPTLPLTEREGRRSACSLCAQGSKVVTQLSEYLRTKDPTLKGYSRRNIYNMVMFYDEYSSKKFLERLQRLSLPDFVQTQTAQMNKDTIVQTASAQLPRILCLMLTKCQTLCEKEQIKDMNENTIKMFFDSENK